MLKLSINSVKAIALALGVFVASPVLAANHKGLSYMANYVDAHPTTIKVHKPFIEKVKQFSNGEVTFDYFSTNVLYPESESYNVLNDGRVDFGCIRPALFEGRMNFITVVEIPYMAQNAIVGSLLAAEVMEIPEVVAEFPKNSVPFTVWGSAAYQLHTLKPVKSLAEIKGKSIITWDAVTFEIAKALGANPIRISSTDTYLSLSKGMADGVICPLAPVRSFKISEVAPHHFMMGLSVGTFTMSIFKPLWDEFSPEMQQFFKEEGGVNYALKAGKSLEDGAKADTEWMKSLGHQFYTPSAEDQAELKKIFAVFQDNWVNKLPKKDQAKGREILKFANERAAFHQAEFEKGKYGKY